MSPPFFFPVKISSRSEIKTKKIENKILFESFNHHKWGKKNSKKKGRDDPHLFYSFLLGFLLIY